MSKFLTNNNFTSVKDHQTNVQPYKALQIGPIDFYLCPKCATNTLRYASYKYNHLDSSLVLPEYRNIKDQTPPSHLLIDAVIEYAKRKDKPLILGIFNLDGVERAKKLFIKKGFHQIGGMYYKD